MKIGLMLGGLQSAAAFGALAAEAETLGFDSLWAGDHIAFPSPILDPLTLLACYAAHTRRVKLGTCVYLLALRHPTPVAKMVASLDFISDGRVVFGVGVGGEFPGEFQASGIPVRERGARTNEAIDVLRTLWRGDGRAHRGRFFDIDPVRLAPLPVQSGGPPIWIGGRSDPALRRAATRGDGYVGYLMDAVGFAERFARIRTLAAAAGRADRPLTSAMMAFALIDADRTAAITRAGMMLGAMYGRPMESAAARYCIVGDAGECRAAAQRYAEVGVEHLILTPMAYGEATREQIRALAQALYPA
jgi:probable F420-dependent oxidoreductase